MNRRKDAIFRAAIELAQRVTEEDVRKAEWLYDELGKRFWPVIGVTNLSAISTMYEAIDIMESSGMLRQRVKQLVNQINRKHDEYCKATHAAIGDRYYFWQDLITRSNENLRPDIMKLHYSIKSYFDRRCVPDSAIVAYVHTAMTLLMFSTRMFDEMMAIYQEQTILDITSNYKKGRLTAIENLWSAVSDIVTPRVSGGDLVISDDDGCQLAINVIAARYQTMDFINEASKDAMMLNPEMEKYAPEEDRHFFTGKKESI